MKLAHDPATGLTVKIFDASEMVFVQNDAGNPNSPINYSPREFAERRFVDIAVPASVEEGQTPQEIAQDPVVVSPVGKPQAQIDFENGVNCAKSGGKIHAFASDAYKAGFLSVFEDPEKEPIVLPTAEEPAPALTVAETPAPEIPVAATPVSTPAPEQTLQPV